MRKEADLIVIGAGAAGMMAALVAAQGGARVILLERNRTLGRKLAITGGGRCNLTNQTDLNEIVKNTPGNGRFLYSALQQFDAYAVMDFFEKLGVPLKVERGRRVFPVSELAQDVVMALKKALKAARVEIFTETRVSRLLLKSSGELSGVVIDDQTEYAAAAVLVATGGASYPATGSTGDGYQLAKQVGHQVIPPQPALIPLVVRESWVKQLEGLSLINVEVTSFHQAKKLQTEFGEMLFTGFGLTGPVILSLSRKIVPLVMKQPSAVSVVIDLKPALSFEQLDQRIQRDFTKFIRKNFKNALDELLPSKLIPVMVEQSGIEPERPVHQITKEERLALVKLFKEFTFTIEKPRPIAEAIVTVGGVSTKELNPKNLESKLIPGLYFAGEVVDVDAYTGGYNLQLAFSMGYAVGRAVAERLALV